MWTTTYKHKNVTGVVVSGGMGYKKELVSFDVGDEDMVSLIMKRDPVIFDFLVDAILNIRDLSDLMWSSEGYYVDHVLPGKFGENKDALKERIKHLISVAPQFDCLDGAKNLQDYLDWMEEQEARQAQKEKARTAARVVRADLRKKYDELFMQVGRRDGFCCAKCGVSTDLTIDHKIAVINGGTNDPDNLQLMCRFHNSSKGAK